MIRRTASARLQSLGDREIEAVVATSALVPQDNLILVPSGCQLDGFRANPVVLWSHMPTEPIGRADVRVSSDALRARITFAPEGISETADRICGLSKASVVNGLSIGFDVDETEPVDPNRPQAGRRATRWTLFEISLCSVPADGGALITARSAGMGRALSAEDSAAIIGAAQSVDECLNHHHDLCRGLDRGDDDVVENAARRLGQSLRRAQKLHSTLADAAAQADLDASKTVQSSSGVGVDHGSSPATDSGGRSNLRYDPANPLPLADRITNANIDHINAVFAARRADADFERRQAEAAALRERAR
jgi:HK97 family phage prohead protease